MRKPSVVALVVGLMLPTIAGMPAPAVAEDTGSTRIPIPDQAAQIKAKQFITDLFKNEYAMQQPQDRAALAKKLLEQGRGTDDVSASKYVSLCEARDLATLAGDADTALRAVEEIAERYMVDGLEQRLAVLGMLIRSVRTPEAADACVGAVLPSLNAAVALDRYDLAKRLIGLASAIGKKTQNVLMVNHFVAESRRITFLQREYDKVKSFIDFLKVVPDDPDANLAVGLYVCMTKGDFQGGLPYLVKGNDESLRALAAKDLAAPKDPAAQVELGDGWAALAEDERGAAQVNLRTRAAFWYTQALPNLRGLDKSIVEAKLKEISRTLSTVELVRELTDGTWKVEFASGGSFNVEFRVDGTCSFSTHLHRGHWTLRDNGIVVTYEERPSVLQNFQLVGGVLYAQHNDPPNKDSGRGTKNR